MKTIKLNEAIEARLQAEAQTLIDVGIDAIEAKRIVAENNAKAIIEWGKER